ncbi:hypothetical protein I3F58_03580 [Streptomyces sp. MUM 203J]|uniref:hypothetical protein n=1 Tax=Streptomyces sp. MUM 203J TaxID=2791990 RepID=UPI001F048129|nr:hypothetical protein [Streptomyces sp. MUM 203J]MCH0538655.1 hypothetical protein [Streptomyces sp. MUM 203J]
MNGEKATTAAYSARYGWDRRTLGVVAVCAAFCSTVLLPGAPLALYLLVLPFFGGGGLFLACVALSRRVAFRVDESGVLLGGTPPRHRATTAHVPWDDIEAVVLWRQTGAAHMPYVGLARREDAPRLPGAGQGDRARALSGFLVPDVPPDVVMASRAVNGWRLDKDRLAAAVAAFAPPGVEVLDAW